MTAVAPVLALHPLGSAGDFFDDLRPHLTVPVLAPDLPGHGSCPPTGARTLEAMTDDVARDLAPRLTGPVVVLGVSLGGLVAQQLAIRFPALVAGLVLVGTVPRYPDQVWAQWAERAEDLTAGRTRVPDYAPVTEAGWLSAGADAGHRARLAAWLGATPAEGYADACRVLAAADTRAELPDVRVPLVAACGEGDGPAFQAAVAWFGTLPTGSAAAPLPGRHATTWEFPAATAALVDDVVQRVADSRSAGRTS